MKTASNTMIFFKLQNDFLIAPFPISVDQNRITQNIPPNYFRPMDGMKKSWFKFESIVI